MTKTIVSKIKIKIIAISVLIVYLTIKYLTTPYYCVDFACFHELEDGILKVDFLHSDSVKDLIVLISVFPEHASGAGCFDKSVQKDETVDFLGHHVKLTDTGLLIDNRLVKTGDSIEVNKIQIKPKNLWWIYHNEFKLKNFGPIFGVRNSETFTKLDYPRYFVAGYYSTKESFNFVTALIYVGLIVVLVLNFVKIRKI